VSLSARTGLWALLAGLAAGVILADPAWAQSITLDMGDQDPDGSVTGRALQLIALITVLTLAPSILIMMTSFTRIVVVLSLMRSALGVQQTPPNSVLISLALFLTFFIMAPTFEAAYEAGIEPLLAEQIDEVEAFERAVDPFHAFMRANTRERDLGLFLGFSQIEPDSIEPETIPLQALIPAFMISELRRAFEIGFLLFLPFLIIDIVVASILMSMGMMMLPPVIISLPFKLIFFVLVDGWYLIAGSLVESYTTPP